MTASTEPLAGDREIIAELLAELDGLAAAWRRYAAEHPAEHGPLDPHARYLAGLTLAADQLAETLARARSYAEATADDDDGGEPEPAGYDPGPACDDQGGASEYPYLGSAASACWGWSR